MTWRVGSASGLLGEPEKIVGKYKKNADKAMTEVIALAVYDMKRFTETRPSAKSGKQGRVDTADMLNAIDGEAFWEGVDKIVGRFGFLNRQELYFALQTSTGFTHYLSGEFIEPTFAMRDAAVSAVQRLIKEMGNI